MTEDRYLMVKISMTFCHFDTIYKCDRQTDERTDRMVIRQCVTVNACRCR